MGFEQRMLKFAQSPKKVAIPMIMNISVCVVIMILSVQQSFPINEVGDQLILGAYFSSWFNDVCQNNLIQYLSPFLFDFRIHLYNQDLGLLGCPWRLRNTIYRICIVCLIMIITFWMLVILLTRAQQKRLWQFFTLMQYALFIGLVVTFVLDCDGTYTGFTACRWNFDYANLGGPVILAMINAQWTTTRPPIWAPGAKTPNMEHVQADTSNNWNSFQIVDYCFLQPFTWTCLFDLFCLILTYISFQVNSYYAYNQYYQGRGGKSNDIEEAINDKSKKRKNRRKKSSVSMAEYDGNRANHRDNINDIMAQAEAMQEPQYWQKRKPTYEKNYS
mmetsp:Transcript_42347/g.37594  ORF Transcript_42347/g.37594 Transcript_42347/m.37594 type:complete len:331 (+) Transcript_42347:158-1150(+)